MNKKIVFLIFLTLIIAGCSANKEAIQPEEKNMLIGYKKILMVIAPKDFRDEEYSEPRELFDAKDYEVKVASIQHGVAVGAGGKEVNIDLSVSEVNADDYDMIVFIGGPGMAQITGDASMQILAEKFFKAGKLTAAICVAPEILAKGGILKGLQATAWVDSKKVLEENGAEFIQNTVVRDHNVITANGPEAAKEFANEIVKYLEK